MKIDNASKYYELDEDGYLIGYRVEVVKENPYPLTMESLDNDDFLFIGADLLEWYPVHLAAEGEKIIIYEIKFKDVTAAFFSSHQDYWDLFHYVHISDTEPVKKLNKVAKRYVEQGARLFITPKDNDRAELSEGFLVYPKENVVSIKVIPHSFTMEIV